jgi:hypothetical protein
MRVFIVYTRKEPGYVPYQTNKNWFLHLYKVGGSKAHKTHSFIEREREGERDGWTKNQ